MLVAVKYATAIPPTLSLSNSYPATLIMSSPSSLAQGFTMRYSTDSNHLSCSSGALYSPGSVLIFSSSSVYGVACSDHHADSPVSNMLVSVKGIALSHFHCSS